MDPDSLVVTRQASMDIGLPAPWLHVSTDAADGFRVEPATWSVTFFVLGWLAFWAYRQSVALTDGRAPLSMRWRIVKTVLVVFWTSWCAFWYIGLWSHDKKGGVVDYGYWPYQGTLQSELVVEPATPIYRRLTIREDVEVNRQGYLGGQVHLDLDKSVLVKLVYTIEVEPNSGPRQQMVIDGLTGMSWRYNLNGVEKSDRLVDAAAVADWLRHALGNNLKNEEANAHANAIVGIVRRSITEELSGFYQPPDVSTPIRLDNPTIRLDKAARAQMGEVKGARPFRNWFAVEKPATWETDVPIQYVGIPVMLAGWGIGLALILRRYDAVHENQATPAAVTGEGI